MKWKKQSNSSSTNGSKSEKDSSAPEEAKLEFNDISSQVFKESRILNQELSNQEISNQEISNQELSNQEFTRISNGDESEEVDCAF